MQKWVPTTAWVVPGVVATAYKGGNYMVVGRFGPRNGRTYKCHHISAPSMDRHLWSLACHGKTLKAEDMFFCCLRSIFFTFINNLQNLTFGIAKFHLLVHLIVHLCYITSFTPK